MHTELPTVPTGYTSRLPVITAHYYYHNSKMLTVEHYGNHGTITATVTMAPSRQYYYGDGVYAPYTITSSDEGDTQLTCHSITTSIVANA